MILVFGFDTSSLFDIFVSEKEEFLLAVLREDVGLCGGITNDKKKNINLTKTWKIHRFVNIFRPTRTLSTHQFSSQFSKTQQKQLRKK